MGTIETPGNPQEEDRSLENKRDLLNLDMKWTYAEQKAKFVSKLESISALNWNASDQALKKSFEANVRFVKTTKGKDRYVAQYDWVDFAYIKANEKTQLTQFIYTFVSDLQQELSNKTTLNGDDHAEIWVKTNTILSLLDLQAEIKNTNQEQDSKKDNKKDLKDVTKNTKALEKENNREEELNQVTAWLMIEKLKQVKNTLDATEIKSLIDQMDKVLLQLDGMQTELDSKQVNDADAQAFGLKYIQLFEQYIGLHKWVIDYLRTQQRLNRIQFPKELAWMDDGSQVWKMRERRMQKAAKLAKKDIKSDLKFDKTYPWIFWSTVPTSRIDQLQQNGRKAKGPNPDGSDDVHFNSPSWSNEADKVAVDSGTTRAPKVTNNPEIVVGADGTIRELKDLKKVWLDELIFLYTWLTDADRSHEQANTIRTALLYRVIKEWSMGSKLWPDGQVEKSALEPIVKKLWGMDKFWSLVKEVVVDSSFISDMNSTVTRNLQLAKAVRADEREQTKQTYLTNYFALTDETEKSAIVLNAFVKHLAPIMYEKTQDPMLNDPLALKHMFDIYKDETNVLDYQTAAADIEGVCGTLWNGPNGAWDVAKSEGIGGLTRLAMTKWVENGWRSIDTAAKAVRVTDTVVNLAQTWFGIAALFNTARWAFRYVKSWFTSDATKKAELQKAGWWNLKKAVWYGLGGYYGLQVLKDPSSWSNIPGVATLTNIFDKEARTKQKIEEQVNSGILISTTTSSEVMEHVFGQKTIDELIAEGMLLEKPTWSGNVAMDVDKFLSLADTFPQLKKLTTAEKRAYVTSINRKLVDEYQLTWPKLEELARTGKKFTEVLAHLEAQNALVQKFKWVLEWEGLWSPQFAEDLQTKTGPEKEALEAKLAFAAQQVNKLNNKDGVRNKYVTNEMTHIAGTSEKALLMWSLEKALKQKDMTGSDGQSFLTSKLKDYLLTDSLSDYFKAVAVVFSNTETFGASPKPSPLYLNPSWTTIDIPDADAPWGKRTVAAPDFVSFIHDATIGNATAWGSGYISSPTLGADESNYINTNVALSSPATKKWEEIIGEL